MAMILSGTKVKIVYLEMGLKKQKFKNVEMSKLCDQKKQQTRAVG